MALTEMQKKQRYGIYQNILGTPNIPDFLWLPFLIRLTGDKQHDIRAVFNLAAMLDLDPVEIAHKVAIETPQVVQHIQAKPKTVH